MRTRPDLHADGGMLWRFLGLLPLLLAAAPGGGASLPTPGSGGIIDVPSTCQGSAAACLGASVPIPGGSAGAVGNGVEECLGGRIVTPDTGGQSDAVPYCPDVDGDGVADVPPSHAQVVAALCPSAPPAVLGRSPADRGVTGLSTWVWSAGEHLQQAAGTVALYPSWCRVQATSFSVDTGDIHAGELGHARVHTAEVPGWEGPDTPIQHLYERVGAYELSLTIGWVRTTQAGVDTVASTATIQYPVAEVVTTATTPP